MALFRRKKQTDADQPAEEAAETREALRPPIGAAALGSESPIDKTIDDEELRVDANPEDDGARTQMIENERRRDEYGA